MAVGTIPVAIAAWGMHRLGVPLEPTTVALSIGVTVAGALAPDIDHPRATISRGLPREFVDMGLRLLVVPATLIGLFLAAGVPWSAVSQWFDAFEPLLRWGAILVGGAITLRVASGVASTFGGHRGVTHSLAFALAGTLAAIAVAARLDSEPWYGLLFGWGWLSHLAADATTEMGLPALMWPLTPRIERALMPRVGARTRSGRSAAAGAFHLSAIDRNVKRGHPGLYELSTLDGVQLKVGIAEDLRRRLKDHAASRQSGLKLKPGGDWSRPESVDSKKSILAKHLFFDEDIAPDCDLKTEEGRRRFLEERCVVTVQLTQSVEEARALEKQREATGAYRYVGKVVVRRRE